MNVAPLLAVRDLSIRFEAAGQPAVQAVRRVSFHLERSQVTALCGPSGAGKSALGHCLLGLLPHTARIEGEARLDGVDLCSMPERDWRAIRGSRIVGIFQEPHAALNPVTRVGRQLQVVCRRHGASARGPELLELVGLGKDQDWSQRFPHQLSGGQAQRVLIAMALACNPDLLVADEPTASLDRISARAITELLCRLAAERQMAVLLISHDRELVDGFVPHQIWINDGRVGQRPPKPTMTPEPAAPLAVAAGAPALRVRGLRVNYGRGSGGIQALRGVDLELAPAEILALVGASGSGKSTLARALAGLIPQASGQLQLAGQTIDWVRRGRQHRRLLQMLFQDPYTSLNPRRRVAAVLAEALQQAGRPASLAVQCLAETGLSADYLDRFPHQLSGGQRQRVALARTLAVSPQVLVLDEAFSALDIPVRQQLTALVLDLSRRHQIACLLISHDLARLHGVADRVAIMHDGAIVECGPAQQVLQQPRHPVTRQLLAAAA